MSNSNGKPSKEQLARLRLLIREGKVTSDKLQKLIDEADDHRVNFAEAAGIVGKRNFFGPNQWLKYFEGKFSMPKVPPIEWSASVLKNPGIEDEHFLFFMPGKLAKKPLTIALLQKLLEGKNNPKFAESWSDPQPFYWDEAETGWYLMPRASVSLDVPAEYKMASTLARVVANILFFKLNGEYFDNNCWAHTKDKTRGGSFVYIRGFPIGLSILKPYGVIKSARGLGVTRSI